MFTVRKCNGGAPVPLKLCQAKLSCGNYAVMEIGGKLLRVPHAAAAQDLKKLLHEKTFDQMKHLGGSGCGELPPLARFGIPRGHVQGPEPRREEDDPGSGERPTRGGWLGAGKGGAGSPRNEAGLKRGADGR
jgi:hypothetical protein